MAAKKARKPARSIRYLLYADQRLKKISLRRISQRLRGAKRSPRPLRPTNSIRETSAHAGPSMRSPWAMAVVGVICVVAAAALIAGREPAPRPDVVRADERPEADAAVNEAVEVRRETRKPVISRTYEQAEPAGIRSTATPALESAPTAAAAAVTVSGCLELDDETFWLKDASGADVQASRSWRSGFLKKRAPRVELVDAANTLRLERHVGQRVSATGTLVSREMQARSLRRVAASCN